MKTKEEIRIEFYGKDDARAYDHDELYIMEQYAKEYHQHQVNLLNEPDVSVNEAFGFRCGVAGCPLCNDRGEYHTGGSFGGAVQIHQCECTKGQTEH